VFVTGSRLRGSFNLHSGGLDLPLAAGMQVSAEILQGKRTVLEYLLSPVQRVASQARMER
jgi:HlyD family secretion protein